MVAAVLEREDPRDALVVNGRILAQSLDDLPRGSRVGTSSLRRRAQLLAARPDLEVAELRGNVPTRLKKIDDGRVHAAILAAAGLHRLGARQHITCYLDAPAWLPAAGQGAIAVQVRADDATMRALADAMNDRADDARRRGRARVPRRAGGGLPGADRRAGACRRRTAGGVLHGMIASIDGTRVVRGSIALDPNDPALSGIRLANELRGRARRRSWKASVAPSICHRRSRNRFASRCHPSPTTDRADCVAPRRFATSCARRCWFRRSSCCRCSCGGERSAAAGRSSMPGVFQTSVDELLKDARAAAAAGRRRRAAVRDPRAQGCRPAPMRGTTRGRCSRRCARSSASCRSSS